jgi:hypothetical protein
MSSLPKFVYEAPVLDASKPVSVRYVLTDEVEANYKTLGFSKFLKSYKIWFSFIVMVVAGVISVSSFLPDEFIGKSEESLRLQGFFLGFGALFVVSLIFCLFEVLFVPSRLFNQLLVESFPVRNESVANWIKARYGLHVEPEVVGELINDSNLEGDFTIEVDGELVRFLTIPDEESEVETEAETEARKESIKAKIIRVATTDEDEVPLKGELLFNSSGDELKVVFSNLK